jgi:hypothetical protein
MWDEPHPIIHMTWMGPLLWDGPLHDVTISPLGDGHLSFILKISHANPMSLLCHGFGFGFGTHLHL